MNKKIIVSTLSILSVLAMMAGATYAFFSDSQTSRANVFASGTLHLALCDTDEPCPSPASNASQSVTATFGMSNMKPGDCTGVQSISLENTGSINAGSVAISASNTDSTLAPLLKINSLTYGGSPVAVSNGNATTFADLADLEASSLTGLSGINAGATKVLTMDVCLDSTATTAVQGLSDTLTLTVNLKQQ